MPATRSSAINLAEVLYRRGDYERARFYIRRVNDSPSRQRADAVARRAHREQARQPAGRRREFGSQLRNRFPQSREAAALERGRFDE